MRVGIDLRPLRRELSGGVVQFVDDLCPHLFEAGKGESFVVYHAAGGYRMTGPLPGHVRQVELPAEDAPSRLDLALAHDRVDVLFRPFPYGDTLAFPARRHFTLLPDLQHEDLPELFSCADLEARRRAFDAAIHRGGAIGLLSQHAEERLRAHFPIVNAAVVHVPPGPPTLTSTLATPLSADEARAIPDGPFFLYPSNLWAHKNHQRLIRAFERFLAARSDRFSLVLTGSTMGNEGLLDDFADLSIVHLGFVSRRLLAELYRRCVALVYFSLYEGFGLPVLEAFQLGAPVLCGNGTSLPEVGADASLQCDPHDVGTMTASMVRIADSEELRSTLAARGRERLTHLDWQCAASRLLASLRTIDRAATESGDALDTFRILGERLRAREIELRAATGALTDRDREIEELRVALEERTAWAERSLASAEERLEVIRAQEAGIHELRLALEQWTARGRAMTEEYRRVSAAAEERLRLIEQLYSQAVAGNGMSADVHAEPPGATAPGDRRDG
jgi:glycosyltransferase involved in cell wall biosynthesis